MANVRRIRIVLAGILVFLVIVVFVFLSRSGLNLSSGSLSGVNVTVAVLDTDLIVQTLFAQTAIAQVNVDVQVDVIIQNPPTATPTPIPSVLPDEAFQALRAEVGTLIRSIFKRVFYEEDVTCPNRFLE